MEADHSQDFNERLSQWIASQGFWFQLRHAMSGGGSWSMAAFHLLSMAFRVAVVLAIVAAGIGFFMLKRTNSPAFSEGLRDKLTAGLNASEAELVGFQRSGGKAIIRRLGATGGPGSFFQSLEAGNLSMDMSFMDAFDGKWSAGVADCNWIDLEIKAGANSPADAEAAARSVFPDSEAFSLQGLTASNARISWGYSERTFGEIERSKLNASRVGGGWRLTFTGGTLSQNWIKDFAIERLVVLCTPAGLVFESGTLKAGGGTVVFNDVKVTGAELPEVTGKLELEQIPLSGLLPDAAKPLISGTVSGEIQLGGSTNSPEGISMTGEMKLAERDLITLRDQVHVLEALDVVDVFHSYKRVDFDRGGFRLESGGGSLRIEDIQLEARDLLTMSGAFEVRLPEKDPLLESFGRPDGVQSFFGVGGDTGSPNPEMSLSLQRAALAARSEEGAEEKPEAEVETEFFADIAKDRKLRREAAERERQSFVFEGAVTLAIPDDSFERSERLAERYLVDQDSGRIVVEVPLNGSLDGLTVEQAENILLLHSERD